MIADANSPFILSVSVSMKPMCMASCASSVSALVNFGPIRTVMGCVGVSSGSFKTIARSWRAPLFPSSSVSPAPSGVGNQSCSIFLRQWRGVAGV